MTSLWIITATYCLVKYLVTLTNMKCLSEGALRYGYLKVMIAVPDIKMATSFSDDIFIKYIFFNDKVWILIKISWKIVGKGPFHNNSLGWLYVFSSFPPRPLRPPPPRPLPQQLLPLTSKPFELNLTYLAQRIYGSGEMYSMAFPWPWPKVTAVASIIKNLLVCTIKWEPLRSLQNMAALLP